MTKSDIEGSTSSPAMSEPAEAPPDWIEPFGHRITIEISVTGHRRPALICGRCGAIVFDVHKSIHEQFHGPIVEDPRYPYTSQARKVNGEPAYTQTESP